MKIQLLVEFEVAYLVREAIENKVETLEYQLEKSNDPLRHRFYDNPGLLTKQLQSLHDIIRQL